MIIAIHSGGDWADASADYVVPPLEMDIQAEYTAWRKWYQEEYCPNIYTASAKPFVNFTNWLLARGATTPSSTELKVFDLT